MDNPMETGGIMELKSKQIYMEKETAFRLLDCHKDNPLYEEMERSYEALLGDIRKLCRPRGRLEFAKAADLLLENDYPKDAVFAMVLYTIGDKISERINNLFEENSYFDAMLLDAMADSCLFSMEEEWRNVLVKECRKRNFGIAKRLEAPVDYSMNTQKRIWEIVRGDDIGISLTSGLMFNPVKTICVLFLLSGDLCQDNMNHDCSRCINTECRLRKLENE